MGVDTNVDSLSVLSKGRIHRSRLRTHLSFLMAIGLKVAYSLVVKGNMVVVSSLEPFFYTLKLRQRDHCRLNGKSAPLIEKHDSWVQDPQGRPNPRREFRGES